MRSLAYLRTRRRSFAHALRGLATLLRTEAHAVLHLAATLLVAAAAAWCGVSAWEACALLLAAGSVWAAEALNAALEALADAVHPQEHPGVRRAKDLAASAVLLASAAAAGVAGFVFLPRLLG